MRFKVLNAGALENPFAEDMLKKADAEYIHEKCWSEDELVEKARDADGVITSPFDPAFTREVIGQLAKCRVISNMGVGYDKIDVDAATDLGVCVAYVPDYCMDEVAEHAMALVLVCARQIAAVHNSLIKRTVARVQPPWVARPVFKLRGQTRGLVGFGRIGRTVVR